jgi:hypothetical protein
MKTLKIKIPDGYEVENFDKETGEVSFCEKPKKVTDRIKTFDDVLKELDIDPAKFLMQCDGLSTDEVAYRKVKLIVQALNEGWTPDWTDGQWNKYYPWFYMGGSSGSGFAYDDYGAWDTYSSCGSRLCFKSSELAKYAGQQFTDIYKDFFTA